MQFTQTSKPDRSLDLNVQRITRTFTPIVCAEFSNSEMVPNGYDRIGAPGVADGLLVGGAPHERSLFTRRIFMLRRPILLLSAFFGLWLAITAKSAEVPAGTRSSTTLVDHSAARVAVLLDEEVPRQGVPLDLPVPVMLRLLEREGIPAVTISPEDLADPERFNARRYSF